MEVVLGAHLPVSVVDGAFKAPGPLAAHLKQITTKSFRKWAKEQQNHTLYMEKECPDNNNYRRNKKKLLDEKCLEIGITFP